MKKFGKKFVIIQPQGLYSRSKSFKAYNQYISEYKNENRHNTRSHFSKCKKGNHQTDMSNSKAGHSHEREGIGKIAAKNLKKLNNPLH